MQFTAKTVDEAIKVGLEQLGLTEEQVEIEIIEQPTKGIFGIMHLAYIWDLSCRSGLFPF